ncbi:MAG: hypothetical protein ACLUAM_04230 [Bifidobacterium adolescentis]
MMTRGCHDAGRLAVFLPAAFAFSFRAVGMYRTEDLVNPHASVQAAAVAALCFIPVVAAQPQLLLPLMLTFLGFLAVRPLPCRPRCF